MITQLINFFTNYPALILFTMIFTIYANLMLVQKRPKLSRVVFLLGYITINFINFITICAWLLPVSNNPTQVVLRVALLVFIFGLMSVIFKKR